MQSTAATVDQYLAELPPDRRAVVSAVRAIVRANIDPIATEGMAWGMIGWSIPHSIYPGGYHTKPSVGVPYTALASQKNYFSLYVPSPFADGTPDEQWFRREWAKSGKKLDMGKTCIRFQRVEDLDLAAIAALFRRVTATDYLKIYAAADPRNATDQRQSSARSSKRPKKAPAKKK